jgi:phage protein D
MAASNIRQPTIVACLNGSKISSVIEAQVERNSFLAADRFSLSAVFSTFNEDLIDAPPIRAELTFIMDGAPSETFVGIVDSFAIDPIKDEVYCLGRDQSSLFIATPVAQTFQNQTSSDIAASFAASKGLVGAIEPTSTPVGRYFQNGRTTSALLQNSRNYTEWDLLTWLAEIEGFEVWVEGDTLCFQSSRSSGNTLSVVLSDCLALRVENRLNLAVGAEVTVRSWDTSLQSSIQQSATSAASGSQPLVINLIRPNLTTADAATLATATLARLMTHQTTVSIDMPGDIVTAPGDTVLLQGISALADGTYAVTEVAKHISVGRGFVQSIEARPFPWTAS